MEGVIDSNNSHELEGEVIDERLGGKGYKPRKDYAGRRVSGDWENSDRGGDNIDLYSKVVNEKRGIWKFDCKAELNSELICSATILCADRKAV